MKLIKLKGDFEHSFLTGWRKVENGNRGRSHGAKRTYARRLRHWLKRATSKETKDVLTNN
jgi:hypothetical protein